MGHPVAQDSAVIWHETECGSYAADLPLWEELAADAEGPVLDLGCGTGRVALHLAQLGHPMLGMDMSERFVATMNRRAGELPAEATVGDARDFDLDRRFGLVLAPMQLVQLFAGAEERLRFLRCVEAHLAVDGLAAFAIVEELPAAADISPPLPDTREVDGWVYSSLPVDTALDPGSIVIRRLRQLLSPNGELSEELDEVRLSALTAPALEDEAKEAGLSPAGRRRVAPTADHVGSTVVLFERAR